MDLTPAVVVVFFVGTTLLSIPLVYGALRRSHARIRAVAEALGFTYHGEYDETPGAPPPSFAKRLLAVLKPWRVTGSRDGVAVAIYLESRGGGKSKTAYTIVEAALPRPLPYRLLVGRESGLAKVGKALFGIQDVEVGSAEFDAEVRIRSADPEAARRLLADARVRERILAAVRGWPHVTLTERAARFERVGSFLDAEGCRIAMDLVVPVVAALRDAGAFEA